MRGFELQHHGRLLTLFSASHYAGRFQNSGAVAVLHRSPAATADLQLELEGLRLHCVEHEGVESSSESDLATAKGLARYDEGLERLHGS